jgi:hypothetical protein
MSIVDTNWIVPTGNPINTPPGVLSVSAGTGVTITGTDTNPIINASAGTGAVTSVEGLVGGIDIVGGNGMTVTTVDQEITLTPTVQSLVAGSGCTIVQSPSGTFTITNTAVLSPGNLTVVTQQYLSPASTSIIGGTVATNLANVTLSSVDPAKNSTVLLKLTLAGIGTKLSSPGNQNQIRVGVFRAGPGTNTHLFGYDGPFGIILMLILELLLLNWLIGDLYLMIYITPLILMII